MKLIKEEFENYAREQGYENGIELFEYLDGDTKIYKRYKDKVPINKEVFTRICWEIGIVDAEAFIKFELGEKNRYREIWENF